MNWLTLEYIKAHCRIDGDDEDTLLTLYGDSAEDTVCNIIGRSYTDLVNEWGSVPKPLYHAALMLVEHSYTQRSPVTPLNMASVPYTFETIVKPYMKLVP